MSKRKAKRKAVNGSAVPSQAPNTTPQRSAIPWTLVGGGIAFALALWFYFTRGQAHNTTPTSPPVELRPVGQQAEAKKDPDSAPSAKQSGEAVPKDEGSFLDAFNKQGQEGAADGAMLANADLEKAFQGLSEVKDRFKALGERARAWNEKDHAKELQAAFEERERLQAQFDQGAAAFDKDLKQAREARPADPVPAWLTGELLILINGEPEVSLRYLRRAAEAGLNRPRVFASMARMYTECNLPDEAFRHALKALDLDGRDRYAWNAFIQAAATLERFAEAAARLDQAFADNKPAWAETLWKDTVAGRARWQAEQKRRLAEQKADDLPRVRLIIEHRRFARDAKGVALTTIEKTGGGEVILELFEDQAPATVAKFLLLVSQKFYDGTRFHAAEPANLVAGGDPNSKAGDPLKDGGGGPGYVIPDEFDRPDARGHFRGSIGMGNDARPGTGGSQFYVTFAPNREMDGHFTVFGRVIAGQEVIDRITLGRTNPNVGRFGLIIPGDLLVRAEVIRKRAHEYKVIKLQPK